MSLPKYGLDMLAEARKRVAELEAQLAALQWRRITALARIQMPASTTGGVS